ncbi:MAG: hypothetical protein IKM92_02025 [Bacteroidaceae bacterium]|nr:hypothetical protein [Bacteroidaceae bacterium]MBR6845375.1 hypothetical protein [Bacteroidaceae bacterium]
MITPLQQIQRALRHVATRFPKEQEPVLTDISLRVYPHSGEVRFFDDEENELMRIVIPEWIKGSRDEDFYQKVTPILQEAISGVRQEVIDNMSLLRPYSFVLQDEDGETLSDLYLVDDQETMILSGTLLEGLDDDLNTFFENLMKE